MASATTLLDGTYTSAVEIGAPRYTYPFRQNGDTTSNYFEQDYWQLAANFTPVAYGTVSNVAGTNYYLISESQPAPTLANVYQFTRLWSKIPAVQNVYSSQAITKPAASTVGTLLDADLSKWISDGTSYGAIYTYGSYWYATALNKVYGAFVTTTSANNAANTRVTFSSAHGIAGTEELAINSGSGNYRRVLYTEYSVFDSTTIDLLAQNLGTVVTQVAKYRRDYTSGTDRVGTKLVTTFYLPGVSPGITTAGDIPIPAPLLNDADFIVSAATNLTGYQTYDSSALSQWMGTAIYMQTSIQINMADI